MITHGPGAWASPHQDTSEHHILAAPGGRAIASYRREGSPLLSGFVYGAEVLAGRAALLEAQDPQLVAWLFLQERPADPDVAALVDELRSGPAA